MTQLVDLATQGEYSARYSHHVCSLGRAVAATKDGSGDSMAALESTSGPEGIDDAWMDEACCKGLTRLFFPVPAERPQARARREAAARATCLTCPVIVTCRDFARSSHSYGFWGGETEEQRHAAGYHLIAPIGVRARSN